MSGPNICWPSIGAVKELSQHTKEDTITITDYLWYVGTPAMKMNVFWAQVRDGSSANALTRRMTLDKRPGFQSVTDRRKCCSKFPLTKRFQKAREEVIHPDLLEQMRWMNAFPYNDDN